MSLTTMFRRRFSVIAREGSAENKGAQSGRYPAAWSVLGNTAADLRWRKTEARLRAIGFRLHGCVFLVFGVKWMRVEPYLHNRRAV